MFNLRIKECPSCDKEMVYNNHYQAYECSCGKTYNAALQELRPIKDWADEYDSEEW